MSRRRYRWCKYEYRAGGVLPVGQQDQYATLCRPLLESFDGQSDGITNRGFLAGKTDLCLRQEALDSGSVKTQWRLHIGVAAKQNQPQSVATALADELGAKLPDRIDARHQRLANLHILNAHGAGNIHCHHQVAAAVGKFNGLAYPHGASCCQQQQQPQ